MLDSMLTQPFGKKMDLYQGISEKWNVDSELR